VIELRAVTRIECNRGTVAAGQHFTADPESARHWLRHRQAALVNLADARELFLHRQRINAERRQAA